MKTLSPYFFALILLASCANENKQITEFQKVNSEDTEELISAIQPIEGLEIAPEVIRISTEKTETIVFSTGSKVTIPENAFVDNAGNPVKGEVDVSWKEFHSLTEIMFSGIPMQYDSSGVSNNLVSGGMFTIEASSNGKKVDLAPGKSMDVSINSINDQQSFNFYKMDDQSGAWDYVTTAKGTPIQKEALEVETMEKDYTLIDAFVNYSAFPELRDQNIIAWKTTKKLSTKEQKAIARNIANFKLFRSKRNYELVFTDKTHDFHIPVSPYLREDVSENQKEIEEQFDAEMQRVLAFQQKEREGRVVRSISINGFGTFNWDCIHRWENPMSIMAEFNYPEGIRANMVSVFFISPEENLILNCAGRNNLIFDPKRKGMLLAILPNNTLSIIAPAEFQEMVMSNPKGVVDFDFNKNGPTINTPEEVNQYIPSFI